jgi:cysteinyl-tRNA synthetase
LIQARTNLLAVAPPGPWGSAPESGAAPPTVEGALRPQLAETRDAFYAAMDDDFNTAAALAALYALGREINRLTDPAKPVPGADRATTALAEALAMLDHFLEVLGLQFPDQADGLSRRAPAGGPSEEAIAARIAERAALRQQRRWAAADAIRRELAEQGVIVEDRPGGAVWRRA